MAAGSPGARIAKALAPLHPQAVCLHTTQANSEQAIIHGVGMHTSPASRPGSISQDAAKIVLALVKKLHRSATAESLALSLPVLRRILATNTLREVSLPQLHNQRAMVQRKHVLRTLVIEVGFLSWEEYRRALKSMTTEQVTHFDVLRSQAGYPNLWFSSPAQAREHAQEHGGRMLSVGSQAVVLPEVGHSE